jgi:DNA-directed RNA polymerase subunit RPC12/RpoP
MFVHRGLCDRCGQCGSVLTVDVPQRLVEGRFRWYEYCHCPRCGSRLMIDGHGLLPHDLRAQILAAGWWLLAVDEASSVPLLAFLKRRFSLDDDRPRLLDLRQPLPGPLFAGARANAVQLTAESDHFDHLRVWSFEPLRGRQGGAPSRAFPVGKFSLRRHHLRLNDRV